MVKIVDSTLALLNDYNITKEQALKFCELMKKIGIVDLEISKKVYKLIHPLPEGFKFYMIVSCDEDTKNYHDIYKFIYHREARTENDICQVQINDVREIIQLKAYKDYSNVRIVGLDDMICHKYNYSMEHIVDSIEKSNINFCPENNYGCAVALAVQWILNGHSELTTSFAGCGNRAATEEVILSLRIATRYKINQKLDSLMEIKKLYEEITGSEVPHNKPVIGSELFDFEAGIHVDGILKNPSNYVPFLPKLVGQDFKIKIGKHSGRNSIKYKLDSMGIKVEKEEAVVKVLLNVKKQGASKKRGLKDDEFIKIVDEVLANEKEMDS